MGIEARDELTGILSAQAALCGTLTSRQDLSGVIMPRFAPSGQVADCGSLSGVLSYTGAMTGELTLPVISGGTPYSGAYEVTPSQERQRLSTGGKVLTADIVINPIPQNYGLITWNGAALTVS